MNVFIGNWVVSYKGLVSTQDLRRVQESNVSVVKLEETSYWDSIHLVEVQKCDAETQLFLAIHSVSTKYPYIIAGGADGVITVATERIIVFIDINAAKVLKEIALASVFFFAKWQNEKLIIITEVGIIMYDNSFNMIQNICTDVIERFQFDGNTLTYAMSSKMCKIKLE
jgi:hypothetical protein